MKMLYLDNLKRNSEISLYINSPGGNVDDTMAIYDTMLFTTSPIATYCIGRAQSGAAIILAAGEKGKRHALPHAKVMLHQPWGGVTGQAADIKIQAEQILKAKKMIKTSLNCATATGFAFINNTNEIMMINNNATATAIIIIVTRRCSADKSGACSSGGGK